MKINAVLILVSLCLVGCQTIDIPMPNNGPFIKLTPPPITIEASGRIIDIEIVNDKRQRARSKVIFKQDVDNKTTEHIVYLLDATKREELVGKRAAYSINVKTSPLRDPEIFKRLISAFESRFILLTEEDDNFYRYSQRTKSKRIQVEGEIVNASTHHTKSEGTLLRIEFKPKQTKKTYTIYTGPITGHRLEGIVGRNFLFDPAENERELISILTKGEANYIYDFNYHFVEGE